MNKEGNTETHRLDKHLELGTRGFFSVHPRATRELYDFGMLRADVARYVYEAVRTAVKLR